MPPNTDIVVESLIGQSQGGQRPTRLHYYFWGLCARHYIALMLVSASLVLWLNYYAVHPEDLHGGGDGFNKIIRSGFNCDIANAGYPTYPMWGYGWLLFVTDNQLALMLIQLLLAICAVAFAVQYFERAGALPAAVLASLKVFMGCAFPWFAFHSYIYPSSISVSVFLIAFILLNRGMSVEHPSWRHIVGSGLLMGLSLNFRSEYCYLPILIMTVLCWFGHFRIGAILRAVTWMGCVCLAMLPWMVYTRHVCGHALIKSTNAGHVAFISLGNLPGNKWGITDRDDDPLMAQLIHDRFGDLPQAHPSLLFEPDLFLQEQYFKRVREEPGEFFRRCVYCARALFRNGCDYGQFWRTSGYWDRAERRQNLMEESRASPGEFMKRHGIALYVRLILARINRLYGVALVMASYLVLPITVVFALLRRDLLWTLVVLVIGYQSFISICINYVPRLVTNMYFFLVLNLLFGGWLLLSLLREDRWKLFRFGSKVIVR
jgi:hypothetical protein